MRKNISFNSYLKEDESILWTGQPKAGMQLRDADVILIPISIILVGFAVVLDYSLVLLGAPFIYKVVGILIAIAGLYFGIIRHFLDRSRRKKMAYCITNRRILVVSGKKQSLKTLPLRNIDRLDYSEEKDGSGFIIFGNTNPLWPWLLGKFIMADDTIPGLEMVSDVKQIFQLLEKEIKVEMPSSLRENAHDAFEDELN